MELDTWEEKKNLANAKEVIEEFEKEYRRNMKDVRKQEKEEGTFRRGELLWDNSQEGNYFLYVYQLNKKYPRIQCREDINSIGRII